MPSTALHDLHQALDYLCDAFHKGNVTNVEFGEKALELTDQWAVVEMAIKTTYNAGYKKEYNDNYVFAPIIVIENDHEGLFEGLVEKWCKAKKTPCHCDTIVINAVTLAQDAVRMWYDKDNPKTLHIQFYSRLPTDSTTEDAQAIIDNWF